MFWANISCSGLNFMKLVIRCLASSTLIKLLSFQSSTLKAFVTSASWPQRKQICNKDTSYVISLSGLVSTISVALSVRNSGQTNAQSLSSSGLLNSSMIDHIKHYFTQVKRIFHLQSTRKSIIFFHFAMLSWPEFHLGLTKVYITK